MKAMGDGTQRTEQVGTLRLKPNPPPPQRRVVYSNGRRGSRLSHDFFYACRLVSLVWHDAVRKLMVNLAAAVTPQAADDEQAALTVSPRQLTLPASNNDKPFAAAWARYHFCTPNKKRRASSHPAHTLLQ
jgi:hypothetical protein